MNLALSTAGRRISDLENCPDLRGGRIDNDGDHCVAALQRAPQDNGYSDQRVTGRFLERTQANVLDFQRKHGINPISGVVGPLTRAPLLGGAAAERRIPHTRPSDYSRFSYCASTACHVYLRRSLTREYALLLEKYPTPGSVGSRALIDGGCGVLRLAKPIKFFCAIVGGKAADSIVRQLKVAARQRSCLHVSVGLLQEGRGLRLAKAGPDDSRRCTD